MPMTTFEIEPQWAGQTVLAVLRQVCPGTSWSQARAQLAGRRISVNNVLCVDEARRLNTGDLLRVSDRAWSPLPDATALKIVWSDPWLLVVDKPAGMMSERRHEERQWSLQRRLERPSAEEAVRSLLKQSTPGSRSWVKVAHRLDRETSGLLLVARTPEVLPAIQEAFARQTVDRRYTALVQGVPPVGALRTTLVRDRGDGLRGSTGEPETSETATAGQLAITHLDLVRNYGTAARVDCRLETGRTNQIRIQLAEVGCPVLGDEKYGRQQLREPALLTGRIALHAVRLMFEHPITHEQIDLSSAWPADLVRIEQQLQA